MRPHVFQVGWLPRDLLSLCEQEATLSTFGLCRRAEKPWRSGTFWSPACLCPAPVTERPGPVERCPALS